ncbi:MAG: DUF4465 domain-containing protein [Saprospiraceae bacterium]|nr:DUF4465 domain-containing protein [Saprospiraceae bacterium]MCB9326502.1 DUF4465 domain-containing protein [Lewinellaceae bacterium]
MKCLFTLFLLSGTLWSVAQTPSTFESYEIQADTFLNGMDSAVYQDGDADFPSFFDSLFSYWASGWAISSMTDGETSGYANLYSAKPGSGVHKSMNYAVGQQNAIIRLTGAATAQPLRGVYLTNTTYTHNSMRDGDGFAKKFGGDSGDEPDYFKLKIQPYAQGQLFPDSVTFYLADYTFEDNDQDYIVNEWTWLDLSSLSANVPFGTIDSLLFTLSSTDVGDWGINTPLFFCMDDFNSETPLEVLTVNRPSLSLEVFPNPATDRVTVIVSSGDPIVGEARILRADGTIVATQTIPSNPMAFDLSKFPAGVYYLNITNGNEAGICKILKI